MREERGFTLIEALLALALLGMLAAALSSFYFSGVRAWQRGIDRMEYQQSARVGLETIISNLRFADWIEVTSESEIRYKKKGDLRHGNPLYYRRFHLAGEQLFVQEIQNGRNHASNVAALWIKELQFSQDPAGSIHIAITAGEGTEEVTLQSAILPRNHSPLEAP